MRASIIILVRAQPENAIHALRSIRRHVDSRVTYEVIVIANGLSEDDFGILQRYVHGAAIIRCRVNTGFSGGCNLGASRARGEYLVFLNDDTLVEPGWLENLIDAAVALPRAGAIGSCVRFFDGRVQEAGSIMWRDGSTMPVGRYAAADDARLAFRRRVDYCSACSLLVRRSTFAAVGGFDESYFPAYYEDTDLALAIRARGEEIWYEPRSVIRHIEAASTTSRFRSFLFRRNKARFMDRWAIPLLAQPEAVPGDPAVVERAIHAARGWPIRVLAVDDRLPVADIGSGFRRLLEMLDDLDDPRFSVAIHPTASHDGDVEAMGDRGIEVVVEPLETYLLRPGLLLDAVIVSRPHNYERYAPLIRALQPRAVLIYDVESLFHRRIALQARYAEEPAAAEQFLQEAADMEAVEQHIARDADRLVCIATEEQQYLQGLDGHAPIEFIRPVLRGLSIQRRGPADRDGVLFVAGWMAGPSSPNVDGFRWFVDEVWPQICRVVPDARFLVTGTGPPPDVVQRASASVRLIGYVANLAQAYGAARVVVAPIRYGAGVKNKTMEALQYGTPTVATAVGAEGMGLIDGEALDITDDPREFAARIVTLLVDDDRWLQRARTIETLVSHWYAEESLSWSDVVTRTMHATATKRAAQRPGGPMTRRGRTTA